MAKKKYICCGGYVVSATDNQEHYISAFRLARLYGVDPRECILVDHYNDHNLLGYELGHLIHLIFLYPKSDGNYTI